MTNPTPRPNRLKATREARGLTAHQVAEQLGTREVTIYRYESGASRPSLDVMHKLAKALGASLDQLFPAPEEVA